VDGPHVDVAQLRIPSDRFVARDLAQPLDIDGSWDLAVSLEVAEHLPPASGEVFVAAIAALAPILLFSAAIPKQGGVHHVNEQWPSYWVSLFANHGMVPIDCIRPIVWDNDEVEWWYAQNVLLFAAESSIAHYPPLDRLHRANDGKILPLVHPRLHLESEADRAEREAGLTRIVHESTGCDVVGRVGVDGRGEEGVGRVRRWRDRWWVWSGRRLGPSAGRLRGAPAAAVWCCRG
jgi:hypothetical protein